MPGAPHCIELVGRFDEPCPFHDLLASLDRDAVFLEHLALEKVDLIDRNSGIRSAVIGDDAGEVVGPALGDLVEPWPGEEVGRADRLSDLVDSFVVAREELTICVVPEADETVCGHECITGGVVHDPDLHVGRVGHVPDVQRIHDENPVVPTGSELLLDPGDTVRPDRFEIGQSQPGSGPFGNGRLAGPEHHVMEFVAGRTEFGSAVAVDMFVMHRKSIAHRFPYGPKRPWVEHEKGRIMLCADR